MRIKKFILFHIFLFSTVCVFSQRHYALNSVLASGEWYKIAITREGVYKIDISFLSRMGVNINQISSAGIKLYGNGGAMIPESNALPRIDDLNENAIEVFDGGDGIFNGNDYLLFYAPGSNRWIFDSSGQSFQHQKNLVNDTCYYFLTFQNNGKRIQASQSISQYNTIVDSYDERLFYENDSMNILNSGKQWVGEKFSSSSTSRSLNIAMNGLQTIDPVKISTQLLSRSFGSSSRFQINANGQNILNPVINQVSGNLIDNYVESRITSATFQMTTNSLNLAFTYQPGSNSAEGWLDWFRLQFRKSLSFNNNSQFGFRDTRSLGNNNVAQFKINNTNLNTEVWNVTDIFAPIKMNGTFISNQYVFTNNASNLSEYFAFDKSQCVTPLPIGKISNQNLHQSTSVNYLIITPSEFKQEADRLAAYHRTRNQLSVLVVETELIYNEFGGGNKSATAIRDFIKMYYDKYNMDADKDLKYVLLLGVGNYDTKGRASNKVNHIPCYESDNSINTVLSYTSDDYYGLLEDENDINQTQLPDSLCIAVGRIPVSNKTEASRIVDKIIQYGTSHSLGSWRNDVLFIADDKDGNIFLNAAEQLSDSIRNQSPYSNLNKLYVDAYPVKRAYGTGTSPQVNQLIADQFYLGSFIVNYSGHGNYQQLSSYSILNYDLVRSFNNPNKLPLFITATCDFLPYDDPSKNSIGTYMIQGSKNGAIALFTSPRLMFAGSNELINENILKTIFQKNNLGERYSLGEAYLIAKNSTSRVSADRINLRKFSLIGDPALKLSFPQNEIALDSINDSAIIPGDTLRAGREYTIKGFVKNNNGLLISNFNGTLQVKIFDKPKIISTLVNDSSSISTTFLQQTDLIYNGTANVRNGRFSFSFYISKDILNAAGRMKISLYAENGIFDASGFDTSFYVASNQTNLLDNEGPRIKLCMDDYNFKNGGIVGDRPLLLVRLNDSSGINTLYNGVTDHNIKAIIDGDESNPLILNSFYQTDINTYKSGAIIYQLPVLIKGFHTINLTAWDNAGNRSESSINFSVLEDNSFQIYNLINYPNPVHENTVVSFQLKKSHEFLDISIAIYNQEGRLIHTQKKSITNSNRTIEVPLELNLKKMPSGVYFYKVLITNEIGEVANKAQILLKF